MIFTTHTHAHTHSAAYLYFLSIPLFLLLLPFWVGGGIVAVVISQQFWFLFSIHRNEDNDDKEECRMEQTQKLNLENYLFLDRFVRLSLLLLFFFSCEQIFLLRFCYLCFIQWNLTTTRLSTKIIPILSFALAIYIFLGFYLNI